MVNAGCLGTRHRSDRYLLAPQSHLKRKHQISPLRSGTVEEWNSAEVPSCRESLQRLNGCVDNRSGVGDVDECNTGEVDHLCAGVQYTVRRKVKHDAWISEWFSPHNSS